MNINKTPVQSYSLLGQVSVSDKSLGAAYPQPIATSNLGPKIQQRESCETADTKKNENVDTAKAICRENARFEA